MTVDTDLATLRLQGVNSPTSETDIVGRSCVCPECGAALLLSRDVETELARLQQERERLVATLEESDQTWNRVLGMAEASEARAEAAERELARLQDGLRYVFDTELPDVGIDTPKMAAVRALLADTPDECKHGIIEIDHATGVASCPKCGAKL